MSTDISKLSARELAELAKKKRKQERDTAQERRRQYDQLRDTFIDTVFGKMAEYSEKLREFKEESVRLGLELHDKMYEAYGREKPDSIDHYSLVSADGNRKVTIERQWRCEYDETSTVAIGTIRQVLREKFEGRNKGMYGIIDAVLMKNNKGDYDERLVAKLRKHEAAVDDARFSEALDILARAYKPTTSQTYIRAYAKDPTTGKWVDLPMNWSSM